MNARSIFQISCRVPKAIPTAPSRLFARNASSNAPQHPPRQSSPWTRRLIYAGIFGGLGVGVGSMIDRMVSVPPLPGSAEDKLAMEEIQHIFDIGLPIVQELRNNPNYVEAGVYGDFSEESKTHRLTSGPLSGSKGIALQVRLPGSRHRVRGWRNAGMYSPCASSNKCRNLNYRTS